MYTAKLWRSGNSADAERNGEENSVWSERGSPDDTGAAAASDPSCIGTDGASGVVTLNRPAALNALTTTMRAAIAEAFPRWARDPADLCGGHHLG